MGISNLRSAFHEHSSWSTWLTCRPVGSVWKRAVVLITSARALLHKAIRGLVPRQRSTGGKPRLLGISKNGNTYLRKLFIHGARSVVLHVNRDQPLGHWINQLEARTRRTVVIVAVANKIARIAWAVLAQGECYRRVDPFLVTSSM